MSLCLSRDELRDLTGYRQRAKIFAWLRKNGFRPRLGADGWPRVDRSVYTQIMAGAVLRTAAEPDFAALQGGNRSTHDRS